MADELDLDELARRATRPRRPGRRVLDLPRATAHRRRVEPDLHRAGDGGPGTGERIVLKVAPPGLEPMRNRDVARQAAPHARPRGLARRAGPTVYFEDDGAPPEVPPFHAMNIVPGECLEPFLRRSIGRRAAVVP